MLWLSDFECIKTLIILIIIIIIIIIIVITPLFWEINISLPLNDALKHSTESRPNKSKKKL